MNSRFSLTSIASRRSSASFGRRVSVEKHHKFPKLEGLFLHVADVKQRFEVLHYRLACGQGAPYQKGIKQFIDGPVDTVMSEWNSTLGRPRLPYRSGRVVDDSAPETITEQRGAESATALPER